MANPFVHVELQTKDLKRAKDFYSRLFDWRLEDMTMPDGGTYTMIQVGDGTGGGMFANPDPDVPAFWLTYVDVDDIAAATAKARELGAEIMVDSMKIADYGVMTVFRDPTGATLAMWQNKMAPPES